MPNLFPCTRRWVGRGVRLCLLRPGSAGRTHQKKSRGRARAIATTGVLCSPTLGESETYPAVSGGAGGAENRNAPNSTAALSFVANSEAARYVFVVVVVHDAMDRGRRYDTFVLACNFGQHGWKVFEYDLNAWFHGSAGARRRLYSIACTFLFGEKRSTAI